MTSMAITNASLACDDLSIGYRAGNSILSVVRNVSLSVAPGKALGLVGESGSGKSTLALALAGCLPPGGVVTGGAIRVEGQGVGGMRVGRSRLETARRLSVVFQNPAAALDPSRRIASVFDQRLRLLGIPSGQRRALAATLLDSVKIRNIDHVLTCYPHQLSGGMQQRVVIALALANDPAVLVLDEPTTGLDATVAAEIVELLKTLRRERQAGLLLISHDIGQVHRLCDDIAVMYGGELVEQGPADSLITRPRHPYTKALLACLPSVRERRDLRGIGGAPPSPSQLSLLDGCLFAPRCEHATAHCSEERPSPVLELDRQFRCHHPVEGQTIAIASSAPGRALPDVRPAVPRLQVENLSIGYGFGKQRRQILEGISFNLHAGEIMAVVGESGSGKSTLLKGVMGLVAPDGGAILLEGEALKPTFRQRAKAILSSVRIVFQNPASALNRRRKVGQQMSRNLTLATGRHTARPELEALADKVRLPYYNLDNFARSLSGGLLQRVAIACAIAGEPDIIAFDEPTSALDVSVQADILNLISDQVRKTRAAAIFVTHDLAVVRQVADRVLVLLHGRIVESGTVEEVLDRPTHPYTARLLAAFSGADADPDPAPVKVSHG